MSTDILRICDEVLEASKGITPLPWHLWNPGEGNGDEELIIHGGPCNGTICRLHEQEEGIGEEERDNFEFLAIAANCAPALAEYVKRLHEALEERNLFFNGKALQEKK